MTDNNQSKINHVAEKSESESVSRIIISTHADAVLGQVLKDANDGFEAGKVTKIDAASFMLLWFQKNAPADVINELRMSCVDEMTMFESVAKKAKSSGQLPQEVREALAKHFFGNATATVKKSKRPLKSDVIKDNNSERNAT